MATPDRSQRNSRATSGRVFLDGLIAITILLAGAFIVVSLSTGLGHPLLTAVLSYLGSCLVASLAIIGAYVSVVVAKSGGEMPEPPRLVFVLMYPAVAALGAGVYFIIHNMAGVLFLVFSSKLLGGLVVFGGAWMVLVGLLERQRARKKDAA